MTRTSIHNQTSVCISCKSIEEISSTAIPLKVVRPHGMVIQTLRHCMIRDNIANDDGRYDHHKRCLSPTGALS
jgi:hypothetical protein